MGYLERQTLAKKGDVSNPGNWRPISLTNIFSKILEKLVYKDLSKYLIDNNLLFKFQYSFLPGRSTHETIFRTVKNSYSSLKVNGTYVARYC